MIAAKMAYSSTHKNRTGKVSDKWDLYLDVYDQVLGFKHFGQNISTMLEIGIQNGGSLETWAELLPKAQKIIGCDIDPKCQDLIFEDPRISIIIGDANTNNTESLIKGASADYDLIVDDGSHTSRDIIGNFIRYFPLLKSDGIYIAEDLHCCYWKEYGGGLGSAKSGIEFFKLLIDCVNANNWGRSDVNVASYVNNLAEEQCLNIREAEIESISSIQYFDSLCIIKKAKYGHSPRIISRVVSGSQPDVETAVLACHGHSLQCPDQNDSQWTNPLATEKRIMQLEAELERISNSRSWRLTSPFRKAAQAYRSLFASQHGL
jgi:hypothetical protein